MVTITEKNIEQHIKTLRYFVGQPRIDRATKELSGRLTPPNRFREMLIYENQPFLGAFHRIDRATKNGIGRLRWKDCGPLEYRAAEVGAALGQIEAGLSPELRQQMVERILNFETHSAALQLEWRTAAHYTGLGYTLEWNPVNTPGPEFVATRDGQAIAVECKRLTRMAKEQLSNRTACTLLHSLASAADRKRLGGHIEWTTPLTDEKLDSETVLTELLALLPDGTSRAWSAAHATYGTLTGHWQALPMARPVTGWKGWLDHQRAMKPHDTRSGGCTLPLDQTPEGALSIWLRGPRFTPEEHAGWIKKQVMGAAKQLKDAAIGVIYVEVEGVDDVTVFSHGGFYDDLGYVVFEAFPKVAAICWIGEATDDRSQAGLLVRQRRYCAQWNGAFTKEERAAIPLMGLEPA
ncbi:hypothetical protein [Pseudomarimonas arenosa]|uniref:Uncharacterized protein n=1 Tax=Pseudomarimonas arenosa TaxID=2774145 RepID=A0AAW3ZT05_9GAMM|nr:hypothetical protein [Pseudomarimonas arenosa]MBD8527291.1 hypothetical protein [Pseudomarimonas arenosa]